MRAADDGSEEESKCCTKPKNKELQMREIDLKAANKRPISELKHQTSIS